MKLDISVRKRHPEVTIGYAVASKVKVERPVQELEEEKKRVTNEIRDKYGLVPLQEIPEIKAYQEFYRTMKMDPTKVRPATEYLVRKAISGKFLSINNLVDSCLLASVKHWAIASVYDLDKVKGVPTVTFPKQTEIFQLIDGRKVTPNTEEIIIRDDEKILTAYALGDAKATMVTPQTKNALIVVWNAPGISHESVENALRTTINYAKQFFQATVEESQILT